MSDPVAAWSIEARFPKRSEDAYTFIETWGDRVFRAVWRVEFTAPGFCLVDLGPGISSPTLRSLMLRMKEQLSKVARRHSGVGFGVRSLGRFDQQETTKFHLDGAPERSLLMLGYEPSTVRSRLFLADYSRCAFDQRIEPRRFLDEFNPMYRPGEERLAPYVTELPEAIQGHSRILFINNSCLPFTETRTHPLGVLHKAEIPLPDPSASRVVNSAMLVPAEEDEVGGEAQLLFTMTDQISQKS